MRIILKYLSILTLIFSSFMMKMDFIMAVDPPIPPTSTTVEVPVTVHGTDGNVEVTNWPTPLKDERYIINGPLPTVSIKRIGAETTYRFVFDFDTYGNYVYQVEEPARLNPDGRVIYDKRVYRLYISVIDDGTGHNKLMGVIEAEDCGVDGKSCIYDDVYATLPLAENTHTPTPATVPTPTPDPTVTPTPKPKVDELYFVNVYRTYWVHYLDGDHGISLHGNTGDKASNEEDKPYGSSHTPAIPNEVQPNSGYKFTGKYQYIIYEEDAGKTLEESKFDENKIKEFEWISSDGTTTYKWDGTQWIDQNGDPITPPPNDAVCKEKTFTGSEADKEIAWVSADGKIVYKWDGTKWVDSNGNPNTPPSDAMSTTRVMGVTDDPTTLIITGNIELIPMFEPIPTPDPTTPVWWVPYTGDPTNLMLYGGLFIGSILIILFLLRIKKKN